MAKVIGASVQTKSWDDFEIDGKIIKAGSKKELVVAVEVDGQIVECRGKFPSNKIQVEEIKLG